jgi:hypothetical protein
VRLVLLVTGAGLHGALQQAGRGGRDGQPALVVLCAPSLADPPPRQPALPSAPLEAKRRWCAEGEYAMAGLTAVPPEPAAAASRCEWVYAGAALTAADGRGWSAQWVRLLGEASVPALTASLIDMEILE